MSDRALPDGWPAPNEYLIELGRIMALWGSLEGAMNVAIGKLAGFDETLDWRAAVLLAHSNFNQRLDILATLCDQLKTQYKHLANHKSVVEKIRAVQNKRNRLAHDSIFLNEETGEVQTASLTARGKLKTSVSEVTVEELRAISADIHEALLDLHHLITQKRYAPIWERSR